MTNVYTTACVSLALDVRVMRHLIVPRVLCPLGMWCMFFSRTFTHVPLCCTQSVQVRWLYVLFGPAHTLLLKAPSHDAATNTKFWHLLIFVEKGLRNLICRNVHVQCIHVDRIIRTNQRTGTDFIQHNDNPLIFVDNILKNPLCWNVRTQCRERIARIYNYINEPVM